jgi:hypothetical protein
MGGLNAWRLQTFYFANAAAGATTVTFVSAGVTVIPCVFEYVGPAALDVFGYTTLNSPSINTVVQSPTVTVTAAGLVLANGVTYGGADLISTGQGFTNRYANDGDQAWVFCPAADRKTTSGSYFCDWTCNTIDSGFSATVAFKPPSAGATVTATAGQLSLTATAPTPVPKVVAQSDSYQDVVMKDSPIAYWRLEETTGPMVDRIGGRNFTTFGSPTLGSAGPLLAGDNAVVFNGTSAYLNTPYAAALNPSAPFSAEAWVRWDGGNPTAYTFVVCTVSSGNMTGWGFIKQSNTQLLYLVWGDGSVQKIVNGVNMVSGTWYHAVFTHDGTTGRFYINGVSAGAPMSAVFVPSSTMPLRICAAPYSVSGFHNGAVDEIALYNVVLTPAQILAHYNYGRSSLLPSTQLSLTGYATANSIVTATAGVLNLTAPAPTPVSATVVAAPAGTLSLTASAPSLSISQGATAPAGVLNLTAVAPTAGVVTQTAAPAGVLNLTAPTPTITVASTVFVQPTAGVLTLTISTVTFPVSGVISATAGILNLIAADPAFSGGSTVVASAGLLTLAGVPPGSTVRFQVPVGSLTLTGVPPISGQIINVFVDAPVGILTLDGIPPHLILNEFGRKDNILLSVGMYENVLISAVKPIWYER